MRKYSNYSWHIQMRIKGGKVCKFFDWHFKKEVKSLVQFLSWYFLVILKHVWESLFLFFWKSCLEKSILVCMSLCWPNTCLQELTHPYGAWFWYNKRQDSLQKKCASTSLHLKSYYFVGYIQRTCVFTVLLLRMIYFEIMFAMNGIVFVMNVVFFLFPNSLRIEVPEL